MINAWLPALLSANNGNLGAPLISILAGMTPLALCRLTTALMQQPASVALPHLQVQLQLQLMVLAFMRLVGHVRLGYSCHLQL